MGSIACTYPYSGPHQRSHLLASEDYFQYHPQPNGMVERFNGRISEMLKQTKFTSSSELKQARYLRLYNHHIPQSSLGYLTPVEALKKWQKSHIHLSKKSIYNETKPDK